MNLRSVDLNLLVVLDALLNEHQVTRAAERVGLSQPAMSNALSRLRHIFKDELLVRTASGMRPTPRAETLRETIRPVLRQIERVFEADAGFDPARSIRTFAVRCLISWASFCFPDYWTIWRPAPLASRWTSSTFLQPVRSTPWKGTRSTSQ